MTTNGTLTATLATQVANRVWAGPSTGADAAPTFRALVALDMAASVAGTAGTIAKFTATNVVGNSIITESGAAISVAGTVSAVGPVQYKPADHQGSARQTAAPDPDPNHRGRGAGQGVCGGHLFTGHWLPGRPRWAHVHGSVLIGYLASHASVSNDLVTIGYRPAIHARPHGT